MSSSSRLKFNKWEAESSFLKKLLHHVQKPYVDLCCSFWCSKLRRTTLIFDGYTTAGYWKYWAFPNSNSMPLRLNCATTIFHIKEWITWTESQSLNLQSREISYRLHKDWPICTMLNSHAWCWVRIEEVISWPASRDLCELIKCKLRCGDPAKWKR